MDLQRGFPLLMQQFKALFVKNFILSWRNKVSTFAQLLSPLFFLFLLFATTKWSKASKGDAVHDPVALSSLPIPPCEAKFYSALPCFDFAWSSNDSAKVASIVRQIMASNPGRKNSSQQDPNFSWMVGLKEFAHPAKPGGRDAETTSFLMTAPPFLLAITMLPFIFQISSLVAEKQLKLRQAMTIMNLYDTAYWLSWLSWEATLGFLLSLITVLCGRMFRFPWFLNNSFMMIFLVFYLFQLNMILDLAARQGGFSWSKRSECFDLMASLVPLDNPTKCTLTMTGVFKLYIATFFLWFVVAVYLDNIIPNSSGVHKSIFYFLNPGYWTGKGGKG